MRAAELYSKSPRAIGRRNKDVNERGLLIEHHGKDHGYDNDSTEQYHEEVHFNNKYIQMNTIGIGLINEFRLLHSYVNEYDPITFV